MGKELFILKERSVEKGPEFPSAIGGDGYNPLELSIKKWEFIVGMLNAGEEVSNDGGLLTCGLCILYDPRESHCAGCPVRERTGLSYCNGTPYEAWEDEDDFDRTTIAEKELAFLESLRPTA